MDGFADMTAARAAAAKATEAKRSNAHRPIHLNIVNPVNLHHTPIPWREWIVEDWLPIGCVTANYGDGGTGKTLLGQQLMTSTAIGGYWCGRQVIKCRSFALFCEDDETELYRRQVAICDTYGIGLDALEAMRWISGVGQDNTLMAFDHEGGYTTHLYDSIRQAAIDHEAKLVLLDTAADLFGGNENDRHQVRRFIGQLNKLAIDIKGAVLLNAHPSRTGLSTGNLDGGSTAWSNSVRSRWSLARPAGGEGEAEDPDARVLTRRKANYARIGEDIALRWVKGVLMPQSGSSAPFKGVARQAAADVFLALLDRCAEQGVFVSHSRNAGNFAPKVFAQRSDRDGYTRKEFDAAMASLFEEKRIRSSGYRAENRNWLQRIERQNAA